MEEKKYKVMPVISRMLKIMRKENSGLIFQIAAYAIVGGLYPFAAVILP